MEILGGWIKTSTWRVQRWRSTTQDGHFHVRKQETGTLSADLPQQSEVNLPFILKFFLSCNFTKRVSVLLSSASGRRHERVTGRFSPPKLLLSSLLKLWAKLQGNSILDFSSSRFEAELKISQNFTWKKWKDVDMWRRLLEERRWGLCWFQGSGWKWCVAVLLLNEPLSRAPEQKSNERAVWLKAVTTQQASMMLTFPLISLADAETWGHGKIWQESASLATATPRRITWAMLNMPGVCCPEPGPPHLMQI